MAKHKGSLGETEGHHVVGEQRRGQLHPPGGISGNFGETLVVLGPGIWEGVPEAEMDLRTLPPGACCRQTVVGKHVPYVRDIELE